jgi:NADPH:quinone reductase-like Zn-dependent oxidoreductase
MVKLFAKPKLYCPVWNNFIRSNLPAFTRTMATGAARNEDLKASKLFDVHNYCAVVTGGGTGIGLMITQTLVANGARVYITGRRKEALDIVVDKYSTGPGKIIAYVI